MTQSAHDEVLVRDDELLFDRLRETAPSNGHGRVRESVREGDVLAGKYSVERIRRRSGLLVSAEARHVDLGERVLMMVLPTEGRTYPDTVARFLRDARAAARIRSEHAARIVDVGWLVSGSPYTVSEFPRGADLADLIRSRGPLPVVEALDYVVQASEAVAESHALDIVHANLSPANLLLTRGPDGSPLVKVLGFGISETWLADPADDRSTGPVDPGALAQALAYFAPEQIRDPGAIDGRVDVWALGAILHELLTGLPMYRSRSMLALATMIAADPPPSLAAIRPDVPLALEQVILACLAKDPASRFESVGELSLALRPFASQEGQSSVARISRISGLSSRPPAVTQRLSLPRTPHSTPFGPPVLPMGAAMSLTVPLSRPLPTPTPPPLPRNEAPSMSRSLAPPSVSSVPRASRPMRLESMDSYGPPESEFWARSAKSLPWMLAAILGIGAAVATQFGPGRQTVSTVARPLVDLPDLAALAPTSGLASALLPPAPLDTATIATPRAAEAPARQASASPVARKTENNPYDDAPKAAPSKRSKGLFDDAD